jgi:hypothetical protein
MSIYFRFYRVIILSYNYRLSDKIIAIYMLLLTSKQVLQDCIGTYTCLCIVPLDLADETRQVAATGV